MAVSDHLLLQLKALPALTRLAYTGFDAGLTLVLALTIVLQFMRLAGAATPSAGRVVAEQRA